MGLTLRRFLFAAQPPPLRAVYERALEETELPVRFVDRRHNGASLLVPRKYDCVGLVTVDRVIELHSALGAALTEPTTKALEALGGQYPLPQADPDNPDYGENWLGTLATADDVVFVAGERTFRVWSLHLGSIESCAPWFFGRDADDALWNGKTLSVRVEEVLRSLADAPQQPVDEPARGVLAALETFVRNAASRGIEHLTVRAE